MCRTWTVSCHPVGVSEAEWEREGADVRTEEKASESEERWKQMWCPFVTQTAAQPVSCLMPRWWRDQHYTSAAAATAAQPAIVGLCVSVCVWTDQDELQTCWSVRKTNIKNLLRPTQTALIENFTNASCRTMKESARAPLSKTKSQKYQRNAHETQNNETKN